VKCYLCSKCAKLVYIFSDAPDSSHLCGECLEDKEKKINPTDPASGFSFCPNCHSPITPKNTFVLFGGEGKIKGTIACKKCAGQVEKVEKIQCSNCGKISTKFLEKTFDKKDRKSLALNRSTYYFCYRCHTHLFGRWNTERLKVKRLIRIG
jgi:hypothetical protein